MSQQPNRSPSSSGSSSPAPAPLPVGQPAASAPTSQPHPVGVANMGGGMQGLMASGPGAPAGLILSPTLFSQPSGRERGRGRGRPPAAPRSSPDPRPFIPVPPSRSGREGQGSAAGRPQTESMRRSSSPGQRQDQGGLTRAEWPRVIQGRVIGDSGRGTPVGDPGSTPRSRAREAANRGGRDSRSRSPYRTPSPGGAGSGLLHLRHRDRSGSRGPGARGPGGPGAAGPAGTAA